MGTHNSYKVINHNLEILSEYNTYVSDKDLIRAFLVAEMFTVIFLL